MTKSVNPEMLTLAREIRGMTQTQLATKSGIGQAKISRYEGSISSVDADHLRALAQTLQFPEEFFFQSGQRFGAESTEIFHRRRRTVPARDLKRIDGMVNLHRIGCERLLEAFHLVDPLGIPVFATQDFETISDIAHAVRSAWKMPSGPVTDLTARLEKATCLVYSFDFEVDKIDEVVQWIPPTPPIILVNSNAPADRLRFSLAHALGHLVMHRNVLPYKEMEKEADQFAAAFLMPEKDIIDDLHPVTIQHMLELKQYWKVSMQALFRRAKDLGVITERRYTSLFQQLSRLGYRKREPFAISREIPRSVKRLLQVHRERLDFTDKEIAKLLKIRVQDYYKWYHSATLISLEGAEIEIPDPVESTEKPVIRFTDSRKYG